MIFDNKETVLTNKVLRSISYHLASREDCKELEYEIEIYTNEFENDTIVVSPHITVFPNVHERKHSDRRGVAFHVIYFHFPEIYQDSDEHGIAIKKNSLVHGTYRYKKFRLTNRRKWVKID